jgi:molecular chaperone DnaK
VVLVDPQERLHVGWDAVNNPLRYRSQSFTISSVKRLMGKAEERRWGSLKTYPQEISALIIALLKLRADTYCRREISQAVIAVPAHYDIHQRWATLQAAEIAGFSNVRLINEATAAVLAYKRDSKFEECVIVFDFGAGTLDVSVVEWGAGLAEVRSSAGDDRLGGDDLDQLIVGLALEHIDKRIGKVHLSTFQQLVLHEAARQAKVELTSRSETTLVLPGFIQTAHGPVDLNFPIDRATFEGVSRPFFERAKQVLIQAIKDSGLPLSGLSKLLLIGGTSRIPFVRNMVRDVIGAGPITGLDPDSGVCEGACLLSGVFTGASKDCLLLDVTPASFSVGLKDDEASVLIPRNTTIPTKTIKSFTTTEDNQTELTVRIYQGESKKTSQNSYVGQLRLTGLPPAPSGTESIEVCFDIDADGTLRSSVRHDATGKNVSAVLDSPYRLNPAQLKLLRRKVEQQIGPLRDAETLCRELEVEAEQRSVAASLSSSIARFLQDVGNQLPMDSRALLSSGRAVIGEYLASGASTKDIRLLSASIRSTFEDAACSLLMRRLTSVVDSPTFAEWLIANSITRSRTELLLAIADLKLALEADLKELTALLQILNSKVTFHRLTATHQPIDAAAIFILAQFLGFTPDTVHIEIVRNYDRGLMRTLVLAQLANPSRSCFGSTTDLIVRDEFMGKDCLCLSEYLSTVTDPNHRAALDDCLRHMPLGTWRRAWKESKYSADFIRNHPHAAEEIRREIVAALREPGNPELQLLAVEDLQRMGLKESLSELSEVLSRPFDARVKSRLIALVATCSTAAAIPLLFQSIANEDPGVAKSVVTALRGREADVPRDLVPLLSIAESLLQNRRGPTWAERITLWRLGRHHRNLRSVIRFLMQAGTRATAGD